MDVNPDERRIGQVSKGDSIQRNGKKWDWEMIEVIEGYHAWGMSVVNFINN